MMYEIIILLMVGLATIRMAKKRGGSRYRGFRKLPFQNTVALVTTASDAVVIATIGQTVTEERRFLSIETTVSLVDLTSGDGPLTVGVAHSDYTAAEIEGSLELFANWDEGDMIAREKSRRWIRTLGILSELEPTLNEGRVLKTRLNWRVASGDTLSFWVMNRGGTPTTGALVKFDGHINSVLV